MAQIPDIDDQMSPKFDPQLQTEDIAFHPKEMVVCGSCSRSNPPNRLYCLYCGGELNVRSGLNTAIKTNLRKLESWERGFNVILRESKRDDPDMNAIGGLLSMDPNDVATILATTRPLPLARVQTQKEAAIVVDRLVRMGIKCSIISDIELSSDKPMARLSRIDHRDGQLQLRDFNTGHVTPLRKNDLLAIVTGVVSEGKTDTVQKKQIRGEAKLVNETITATDESVIDIYARDFPLGFRVRMAGFDFSCLGSEMTLLATENMRSLIQFLKEYAANARFVDDYPAVRPALDLVWEIDSHKGSKGVRRGGFGKVEINSEATTSNLNQFTKYSRLQWHLL